MRTIYVLIATKQYETAPKVLRAFHTEADAAAMKEIIDACNPARPVEIFPTQIDMPDLEWERSTKPLLPAPPFHIYGDGGPVKGEPFIPERPDVAAAT